MLTVCKICYSTGRDSELKGSESEVCSFDTEYLYHVVVTCFNQTGFVLIALQWSFKCVLSYKHFPHIWKEAHPSKQKA
jgi:hypothetical protein